METTQKKVSTWTISAEYGNIPGEPREFCYYSIRQDDDERPFVGSVWSTYTIEESERIAKLIAAAPDMLRVIQEADAWLSFNQKPDADQIRVFRKSLQEVIKQATE